IPSGRDYVYRDYVAVDGHDQSEPLSSLQVWKNDVLVQTIPLSGNYLSMEINLPATNAGDEIFLIYPGDAQRARTWIKLPPNTLRVVAPPDTGAGHNITVRVEAMDRVT